MPSSKRRARRALRNDARAEKRARKHEHRECETGLCKACGWKPGRVPKPWLTQSAGTPYRCKSKLIGREVTLRGDPSPSMIVGCATPLGETIFQHGRRGKAYKCQSSFVVRSNMGKGAIETPVPRSVVRARMRHAKDKLCPDTPSFNAEMRGYTSMIEADAKRMGVHPMDLADDMPFPHREGSSPCCVNSKIAPKRLEKLVAAWTESGEESDYDAVVAAVRRALPKHLRAITALETKWQVERAIKAVRDHCWNLWVEKEASFHPDRYSKRGFQKRVREARTDMRRSGLPLTKSQRQRQQPRQWADEWAFLKRADMVSSNQFIAKSPDLQRRLVTRLFRKYRVPMGDFNPANHVNEELLALAARTMFANAKTRE
jgi:hypothetical protein